MNNVISLLAGLLFGLGLLVSGMAKPAKVIGFLDLAGHWDPSLAFVMAGAIGIGFFAFRFAGKRSLTLLGQPLKLPSVRDIDTRLVVGSLTFGVGWGLAGYCPGPALTSLAVGDEKPWVFAGAMVVGMLVFEVATRLSANGAPSAALLTSHHEKTDS